MKLILTLSLILCACAGSPPKIEHPVKLYVGDPDRGKICRISRADIAKWAKRNVVRPEAKQYVNSVVKAMFAKDDEDCIDTRDPEFKAYGAYSFEDIRVMQRFQENLLYSCEKWKQ